jgi:sirohydrochlorin cobaltochelatase
MDDDQIPIVLVASGTATAAAATYRRIENGCRQHFPGHPFHWAYSSRAIRLRMQATSDEAPATPGSVFDQLYQSGCRRVVVQALHLIGGTEFHHLAWTAAHSRLKIHLGLPLLSHPADFDSVLEWIETVGPSAVGEALVLVGHGTTHPAWMAYDLLARRIATRFGPRVLLGQVKGDPSPSAVARLLVAADCRRVWLRPLMLVAGAHFMQDIAGERSASWRAQLTQQGLIVTPVDEGMGSHPSVIDVFARHIREALNRRPLKMD